jgi:hypothetical protein
MRAARIGTDERARFMALLPSCMFLPRIITNPWPKSLGLQIMAWHRSSEASKRLDEIPGVGPALGRRCTLSATSSPPAA